MKTKLRILVSNFFWHLRNGSVRTRRYQWGFVKVWRYKRHGFCWLHGRSLRFNGEWLYWYCPKCWTPAGQR